MIPLPRPVRSWDREGLIITDENTCMVDLAKFFLTFTQSESCGRCVPCRLGTKRMLEILQRITEGTGELSDLETLKELAPMIKDASLCGLGQTCPNPVLTTLNYFLDEYRAHIEEKRCPAGSLQGPDPLSDRSGDVHGVRGLPKGLSPGSDQRKGQGSSYPGSIPVH